MTINAFERRYGRIVRPGSRDNREDDGRAKLWLQVLQLMRRLDADDPKSASAALADLNGIQSWFDWGTLVPKDMASARRSRLIQCLRLMAGTSSVGEARNAYRSALRMMQQSDAGWQWEAA
jgi:hypothetical protein